MNRSLVEASLREIIGGGTILDLQEAIKEIDVTAPSYVAHFNVKFCKKNGGQDEIEKINKYFQQIDRYEKVNSVKLFLAVTIESNGFRRRFLGEHAQTLISNAIKRGDLVATVSNDGEELRVWLHDMVDEESEKHITSHDEYNLVFGFYHQKEVINEVVTYLEKHKMIKIKRF
jgi:hypothetical protein